MTYWRVRTIARLREIEWRGEDETVLYNASVGHTHVINPPVRAVLACMRDGFVPIEHLTTVYRQALPENLQGETATADMIESLLEELARFGVVEKMPA